MKSILSTNALVSIKKSVQTNVYSAQSTRSVVIISEWTKQLIPPNP